MTDAPSALLHRGPIAGIASHRHWIATAGYDNQIVLWDAASRTPIARARHDHLVNACAFSHDGRWLVSASSDASARVWALPSMRLHALLGGHADDVDMAVFSPDDSHIATCALDRCVRIFDRTGHCLHELRGHTGNVLSLAWSHNGRQLVSSSVDGSLRRWDAVRGCEIACTDLSVRSDSVEIDAAGRLYAGDDRGRIAIVDADGTRFVSAHQAGVKKIAFDACQARLVSLSYDRTLALWRTDVDVGLVELARTTLPAPLWARAATVLDDGRIAVGSFGGSFALFDPASGAWDLAGVEPGPALNAVQVHANRVYTVGDAGRVAVDGDVSTELGSLCNFLVEAGGRVFSGGQLGQLFDVDSGALLYEHHSPLNCGVSFSRMGQPHLAIGSYTGEIIVFAFGATGALARRAELRVYENAVKGLAYSDGVLFSVCASTDVAWHRIDTWALIDRINQAHEKIANACCAVGPRQFASVSRDRTLRLWDGDHSEIHTSPHPNSIKCVAVDAEHTTLLTGSYGGTLASFDLRARRWGSLLRPTDAGIASIAWDGARQRFLAASYDGRLYPVAR